MPFEIVSTLSPSSWNLVLAVHNHYALHFPVLVAVLSISNVTLLENLFKSNYVM